MIKKITITVLFVVVFLILLEIFIEGPVGISPLKKGCVIFELSSDNFLIKKLPDGFFNFKYPFSFRYEIDKNTNQLYCLGKNWESN